MAAFWTAHRVAAALGCDAPEAEQAFTSVGTDTRTLEPGSLYVALVGERFDGHDFLAAAADAGARGAVVRRGTPPAAGLALFPVDDTLAALGLLGRERRRSIRGPVVAVTGTNGKTSTKEMIGRVLACRWPVHLTRDNRNNLVGVPLTLLEAPPSTEALVVEAGANAVGEIPRLRQIIEPSLAVVTNVSAGHLEGFRDVAGTLREKVSLLDGVAVAVVGTDPPALAAAARSRAGRVVTAGLDAGADARPDRWSVDEEARVTLSWRGVPVALPVPGRHQGENAAIALAVGEALGVDPAAAAAALAGVALPGGRCEVVDRDGLRIVNDTYNANPASVRASLSMVSRMRGGRRLAVVVGTMLELGEDAARHHEDAARAILEAGPDLVGATGAFVPAFERLDVPAGLLVTADDPEQLGRAVRRRLQGNEVVLLKASRGVRLERAMPFLSPGNDVPCSTTS